MAIDLTKPIKVEMAQGGQFWVPDVDNVPGEEKAYRLLFEKSPGLLTLAHVLADTDIEEMIAKADGSFENWVRGVRLGAKGFIAAIEGKWWDVSLDIPSSATAEEMRDEIIAAAPHFMPLVMARDRVVDRYCEEHGLDKNNLSFEHIFKIRELPEWKNPPTQQQTNHE